MVRDGNVITGGGVTAGIDMALTVMGEIAGPDYAETVQLAIEYAPAPPFDSGERSRPGRKSPQRRRNAWMRSVRSGMPPCDARPRRSGPRLPERPSGKCKDPHPPPPRTEARGLPDGRRLSYNLTLGARV